MNTLTRPRLACLALIALGGCADALEADSVRQHAMSANAMSANALTTAALTANPLTNNAIASPMLISKPLSSATYDLVASPTASAYLASQLVDPFAQELMAYLVSCALAPGQTVTWQHPDPENNPYNAALSLSLEGELGLCPAWAEAGIEDDEACQERISSCLLARNNAYGVSVLISMRGQGPELAMQPVLAAGQPDNLLSTADCQQGEIGPTRNCGWTVEHVGSCPVSGTPVAMEAIGADCAANDEVMMRVCAGTSACDAGSAQALVAVSNACKTPAAFACPEEESFTIMLAAAAGSELPLATATSSDEDSVYPASEADIYDWREGAFFGNVFLGSQALDVSVDEDLRIAYKLPGIPSYVLPAGHRGKQHYLAQKALSFYGAVYSEMYACYSPQWADGPALFKKRICAGPLGKEWCAAQVVGPCVSALESICESSDAAPELGNDDFGACRESSGAIEFSWEFPITTFLDQPCAIVSGVECQTVVTSLPL